MLTSFARVRLLRNALPISLLILRRKKTSVLQCFAIIAIHPILSKLVRNYMNRKNSLFSVQFTSTLFVFEFPQKRSHRLPITRTFTEIEKSSRYRELEENNRK